MLRGLLFLLAFSAEAQNWSAFRGPDASGAADRQNLPLTWNVKTGANIFWKTPVPGLAHSSPIVWGDRIYLTTAVSSRPDATFKRGLYGEGDASSDTSTQQWKVLCLDLKTGKPLWERTAYEGRPKEKRHIKSTYASPTPATDGRVLVAYFGSQGLYAYDRWSTPSPNPAPSCSSPRGGCPPSRPSPCWPSCRRCPGTLRARPASPPAPCWTGQC